MRVLLIAANTELMNMPVLPLGLGCIARATQEAGHEIELLNLMAREDVRGVLESSIRTFQPEVIGFSVRNIDDQELAAPNFLLEPVRAIVSFCRRFTGCPFVVGGAGYSIFPQSALDYLGADIGIKGHGERAFVQLLERLGQGADLSDIPGLYLPGGGAAAKQKVNNAEIDRQDFAMPLPGRHLSAPAGLRGQSIWLPFQTRRGCPMKCAYCSTPAIEGTLLRARDPAHVVDALTEYVAAGFDRFFFVDNVFNLPRSYAKRICERIISAKLRIRWHSIVYPWKMDEELIRKMALAGCEDVSLGFESGSARILKGLNKRFQPDEVRHICNLLKRYGIRTMGFLLLGAPGEDRHTVRESLEFADSLKIDAMRITVGIRIYPYTPLAGRAVKEGMITADDDLLLPRFYIADNLKTWTLETVKAWTKGRRNWIG